AAARTLSPGPLGSEIDAILMRTAPDEYAELRADTKMFRKISKRALGDMARLQVDLEPDEAEAAWQRVCEVADTVCRYDRRARQYRLADAFTAIMHGETALECTCGRDDCAVAGQPVPSLRRKPLVQISIDVATLLGLLSNPAYLHGHGPIDAELARQLASDGTWQAMLTQAYDLATQLGLITTDTDDTDTDEDTNAGAGEDLEDAAAHSRSDDEADAANTEDPLAAAEITDQAAAAAGTSEDADNDRDDSQDAAQHSDSGAEPGSSRADDPLAATELEADAGQSGAEQDGSVDAPERPAPEDAVTDSAPPDSADTDLPDHPPTPSAQLAAAINRLAGSIFHARGTRHRAGWLPEPGTVTAFTTPAAPVLGTAGLTELITRALADNPHLLTTAPGTGGGPPPPRALIYRPDADTAAIVRARDRHCRFPGCRRAAAACQLDHVEPFRHDNPLAGGLTTVTNLQALCLQHHMLKTMKLWHARMLPGAVIAWTNSYGDTYLTLPAGAGITAPPQQLTPTIGNGPLKQKPPPEPDDEPPPF
ncbi:HNH endonuclease signature motif containing protein, partial [Skermania sp. ID1734]|uniref:HNH endonuclease signature motif containing protein n=1 Tax=Skermania sp. ID1734 TaxID=2597516 RepID=UPI00163D8115